jgi:TM2 domain-containing membrane protein YozV
MNDSAAPALVIVLVCFFGYFLPVIAAGIRKVKNWGGLFALNLLLGWTVIGWIAALIWAASGETEAEANAKVIDYARLAAAMQAQQPGQYPVAPVAAGPALGPTGYPIDPSR